MGSFISAPSEWVGHSWPGKEQSCHCVFVSTVLRGREQQVCWINKASPTPVHPTLVPSWDSTLPVKSQSNKRSQVIRGDKEDLGRSVFPTLPPLIFLPVDQKQTFLLHCDCFLSIFTLSGFLLPGRCSGQFKPD